jgi:hypothetical protein
MPVYSSLLEVFCLPPPIWISHLVLLFPRSKFSDRRQERASHAGFIFAVASQIPVWFFHSIKATALSTGCSLTGSVCDVLDLPTGA